MCQRRLKSEVEEVVGMAGTSHTGSKTVAVAGTGILYLGRRTIEVAGAQVESRTLEAEETPHSEM